MLRLFVVASVACTTVACATPTYVTRHGLRVYDKTKAGVPQGGVEALTQAEVDALGHGENLDGVDVFLVDEMIEIPQKNGAVSRTDGYSNMLDNQIMGAVFSDCLWASGLVHELAHALHDRGLLAPDWFHDDKTFWAQVKTMEASLKEKCTPEQLAVEAAARDKPPEEAAATGAAAAPADANAPPDDGSATPAAPATTTPNPPTAAPAPTPTENAP